VRGQVRNPQPLTMNDPDGAIARALAYDGNARALLNL
jgi:hypothetical protein